MDTILQRFTTLDANNINKCSQNGITLLMYFCKSDSNIEYVKALLKNPYIKFDMKNNDGKSAYDIAIENGCTGIISLFNDMMKLIEEKKEEEKFQIVFNLLEKNGKIQLLRHFCSFFDNKKKYFDVKYFSLTDKKDNIGYNDLLYFYQIDMDIFEKNNENDFRKFKMILHYMSNLLTNRKSYQKSWLSYIVFILANNNISLKPRINQTEYKESYQKKLVQLDDEINEIISNNKYKDITPSYYALNLKYEFHHLLKKNE